MKQLLLLLLTSQKVRSVTSFHFWVVLRLMQRKILDVDGIKRDTYVRCGATSLYYALVDSFATKELKLVKMIILRYRTYE